MLVILLKGHSLTTHLVFCFFNFEASCILRDILFKKILFIFGEREREGERKGEKHQFARHIDQLPLICPQTGDLACNPGMCPDWESNP